MRSVDPLCNSTSCTVARNIGGGGGGGGVRGEGFGRKRIGPITLAIFVAISSAIFFF